MSDRRAAICKRRTASQSGEPSTSGTYTVSCLKVSGLFEPVFSLIYVLL